MSKIRGAFPLFLATGFGIVNGIWVFQPPLAEQQEGKDNLIQKASETPGQSKESEVKVVREAEEAASRSLATEAALKPIQTSSSWWPSMTLWSKSEIAVVKETTKTSPRMKSIENKDEKEQNT